MILRKDRYVFKERCSRKVGNKRHLYSGQKLQAEIMKNFSTANASVVDDGTESGIERIFQANVLFTIILLIGILLHLGPETC